MPSAVAEWYSEEDVRLLLEQAVVDAAGAKVVGSLFVEGSSGGTGAGMLALRPRTDLGNAERLVDEHGAELIFAPTLGWFAWDGRRWKRDADGEVMRRAKLTVRAIYAAAEDLDDDAERKKLVDWALKSENQARLQAAVKLAETEAGVIVDADKLDANPSLFNCGNGTIDLQTGELRKHLRDDLLTRLTEVEYDPTASHPLWNQSLERLTGGDAELAGFLQRAVGYSLTGHTSEDKLFFAHGPTATGKSSTLEAIKGVLDEYAATADFESFLKRRGDQGIRNDIARLVGKRLVISIEVDEGKTLAEGLIKMLTGGDTIAARFLYRETFEYVPSFKLWLAANERPRVNADDAALWRRILQIPFVHVIPEEERDERVRLRLRTDPEVQRAILAWAVQGCLDWQERGLDVPASVREYTAEYRAENDPLRDWIADCCQLDPEASASNSSLRASYEAWCETNGERPMAAKTVAKHLRAKGCAPYHRKSERGFNGIRLTGEGVTGDTW